MPRPGGSPPKKVASFCSIVSERHCCESKPGEPACDRHARETRGDAPCLAQATCQSSLTHGDLCRIFPVGSPSVRRCTDGARSVSLSLDGWAWPHDCSRPDLVEREHADTRAMQLSDAGYSLICLQFVNLLAPLDLSTRLCLPCLRCNWRHEGNSNHADLTHELVSLALQIICCYVRQRCGVTRRRSSSGLSPPLSSPSHWRRFTPRSVHAPRACCLLRRQHVTN